MIIGSNFFVVFLINLCTRLVILTWKITIKKNNENNQSEDVDMLREVPKQFLVVDDDAIRAFGYTSILSQYFKNAHTVVCSSKNDLSKFLQHRYSLIIVSQCASWGITSSDIIAKHKQSVPNQKFLLTSMYLTAQVIDDASECGADGVVSQSMPPQDFYKICSHILSGGDFFSGEEAFFAMDDSNVELVDVNGPAFLDATALDSVSLAHQNPELTEKELQVLNQLKSGAMNKQLAGHLNISESTLRTHLRNIYRKMHVKSRTECVSRALDCGMI